MRRYSLIWKPLTLALWVALATGAGVGLSTPSSAEETEVTERNAARRSAGGARPLLPSPQPHQEDEQPRRP
eukprot:COSAG06_NODE_31890_length_514_cov_0.987952_1_plen_70_part_10